MVRRIYTLKPPHMKTHIIMKMRIKGWTLHNHLPFSPQLILELISCFTFIDSQSGSNVKILYYRIFAKVHVMHSKYIKLESTSYIQGHVKPRLLVLTIKQLTTRKKWLRLHSPAHEKRAV